MPIDPGSKSKIYGPLKNNKICKYAHGTGDACESLAMMAKHILIIMYWKPHMKSVSQYVETTFWRFYRYQIAHRTAPMTFPKPTAFA